MKNMSDSLSLRPVKRRANKPNGKLIKHSVVRESYLFSGPIPHPDLLNKYDPATRKMIVSMARDQSRHRQLIEASVIKANIVNERVGIHVAALITIVVIVSGVILLALEKNVAGFVTIFAPLLFHAGNYFYNKNKENEVKGDKREK